MAAAISAALAAISSVAYAIDSALPSSAYPSPSVAAVAAVAQPIPQPWPVRLPPGSSAAYLDADAMSTLSAASRAKSAVARAAACGIPRQIVITVPAPSTGTAIAGGAALDAGPSATTVADRTVPTATQRAAAANKAAAARTAAAGRAAAGRKAAANKAAAARTAAAARAAARSKAYAARAAARSRALTARATPAQRKAATARAAAARKAAAVRKAAARAAAAQHAAELARRVAPARVAEVLGSPPTGDTSSPSATCGSSAVTVTYFASPPAPVVPPTAKPKPKPAAKPAPKHTPKARPAVKAAPKAARVPKSGPKSGSIGTGPPTAVAQSHYIRSLSGHDTDRLPMYRLGAVDAMHNRGRNRYLVLLDIGGQIPDGVRQSINGRFVSYSGLVSAISAYLNGYRLYMDPTSSVTVAVGTNNDLLTSAWAGRAWADLVVDPLRAHAARFAGIDIAGANDIEPGFRNGPAAAYAWELSYLRATDAPLVFNGSADGCSWRTVGSRCNDGWHSVDLARLAGAISPGRITALPQIYNGWQAQQWARISHEAVQLSHRPLTFAGPLTETAACGHDPTCPTMRILPARQVLFMALAADTVTRVAWLPAGTDLDVR